MSNGLRTWASDGKLQLSIENRSPRLHSVYSFGPIVGQSSVNQNVSGMTNDGTWRYILNKPGANVVINNGYFTVYCTLNPSWTSTGIQVLIFRL